MPEIKEQISLAAYTTMKTGGVADYWAVAHSREELVALFSEAKKRDWPVTVIGGGSNMLVSDDGVRGLVIKNEIKGIEVVETDTHIRVSAGAGEVWDDFVDYAVSHGWWGIENLSAIPGTVGATPIQNVGAYGVEVKEVIAEVEVYSPVENKFITMNNDECLFSYRHSIFKNESHKNFVIVNVTFVLNKIANPILHYKDLHDRFSNTEQSHVPSLTDIRKAVTEIRAQKFPDWHQLGTAGSFFKNPIITKTAFRELQQKYPDIPGYLEDYDHMKVSLAWILDKVCNLKGERDGAVGAFNNQPLVLVNYGGATTNDVKNFAHKIANEVFQKTKIEIEIEPVLL